MNFTENVLDQNSSTNAAIKLANEAIQHHETMKNSYFFTPPGNASSRRRYEERHTLEISFEFNGHLYEYSATCNCSCKYVYFQDAFYFDGNKTTVTKFENAIKRMENLQGKRD